MYILDFAKAFDTADKILSNVMFYKRKRAF